MSANKQIVECQTTLNLLHLEMKNLVEHLQLQVSNYSRTCAKGHLY